MAGSCEFFLVSAWLKFPILSYHLAWLLMLAMSLLAGFTWAIYHGLPFFLSRKKRHRLLISAVIALPLAAVGSLALYISVRVADPFEREMGAEFISPTDPANRVLFTDSGFLDRDLQLYAKPKGKNEQFVGSLCFTGEFSLDYAQWSEDGQAVVCSLKGRRIGDKPIMEIIYDFTTHKVISWGDEATISKIIAQHGGLNSQPIDDGMIRKNEKTLYFWQIPKR